MQPNFVVPVPQLLDTVKKWEFWKSHTVNFMVCASSKIKHLIYPKWMFFMLTWRVRDGKHELFIQQYNRDKQSIAAQAITVAHAPGSLEGWILLKTIEMNSIDTIVSRWSELVIWRILPVTVDK